jgi:hypothetical protein
MSPDDLLSESPDKLQNRRKGDPRSVALVVITVAIVAGILLVMKLSGSNASEARIVSPQVSQNTSPPNQPVVHTLALTTQWSMSIYLPDPLVQVTDFSCDIDEYGVLYDVLVNGKYLYGPTAKDQPVPIKEAGRFIQMRISAESPVTTGTMRYSIVPRTRH